ncbi:tetratricopeptide repeat-containing diguanylate cyclase [Cognaticolwellia mytili]|uniref:tetratricopeptide repeat-containing diguanylate cyclase n=1 Tax=Cognaticolwellia mytili TaxID=1888913 RepID=UPI000A170A12|nr:diguanylate cyclase [Cognaticolwellia mytili]
MRKALQVYCVTLILFCCSHMVGAVTSDKFHFSDMGDEIYLQPWLSYQKIIGMQSATDSYNESQYLWWLVRKAQTENLIYFYDDFNATVKQAISLITPQTPLVIQAHLNLYQGIIHQRQGNYSLSEEVLTKALLLTKKGKLQHLYAYAKQELAYTKTLTELFETSLIDIQEAYVEAFALKDQFLIGSINETYGAIYGYLQDYEKSIEYYQRALETYRYLNYPAHIAEAIYGLASTYRYWKKYDLAIEYFKRYQQSIDYTPNLNISFFSAYGLGMTYAEKGDCELAIAMIDSALKLKGLVDYNAELYKRKASCLIALGHLDAAESALFNAASEFSKVPEIMGTAWQLEVVKISGELARARGDFSLGYEMLEQYYRQYTKLLINKSSDRLLKVRANLEAERQKITYALEKKRSEVELLELEKRKNMSIQEVYFNIFIICTSLVVLIIMLVQYRNNRKMRLLAIKDSLSGSFNRHYVFEYLSKAITGSDPDKMQLSIVLIDIDDFKHVNDKFGHPIGDDVICCVADIGKKVFCRGNVFGRIGGEEFLCILPKTRISEAKKIAERFLSLINQAKMISGHQDKVTVSIGIAGLSEQCSDEKQLYINADQALYKAKHLGKNQINIF